MSTFRPLSIALVTDTHVRVEHDDGQRAFPSDARHNDRNRAVAASIREAGVDLVLHLGDVVHPIPTLPTHREALGVAAEIYGTVGAPMVVVPGNHDVGDKHTTAAAPAQVTEGRLAFRSQWGAPFRSLDVHGVHLVVVDGTLLSAATEEAAEQRAWLSADLSACHDRTFVFTHYPPFLHVADEPEHYDNLGPEARAWLLALLADHGVEALFCGHVHRFFYNVHRGVDLYTLPSAAFARPEYAALRAHPPPDPEHGRDDVEHLGWTLLRIDEQGHRLRFVRPWSASPGPGTRRRLGSWLQHRLGRTAELPYGDLDPLTRKTARDDVVLVHLLDLGLSRIRIPLPDLEDAAVRQRVAWLARYGVALTVFSGLPTADHRALLESHAPCAEWEVVGRPRDWAALSSILASWDGPGLTLGRVGGPLRGGGAYHSHFPRQGFDPADPALDDLLTSAAEGAVARIAFRVADGSPIPEQVAAAMDRAVELGVAPTCHVELPYGSEAQAHTDDAHVATRVRVAAAVADAHPHVHVFLDQLADKDRGYWCRHALVDLADRPRSAYLALKQP